MTTESLLTFPCDFPIKIMGLNTDQFHSTVIEIVTRHTDNKTAPDLRPSRDQRYVALSFSLNVSSQAQLDALYNELSGHELVLFVL